MNEKQSQKDRQPRAGTREEDHRAKAQNYSDSFGIEIRIH